jgi:hypothetical protein
LRSTTVASILLIGLLFIILALHDGCGVHEVHFSVVVSCLLASFLKGVTGRGEALVGLAVTQFVVSHSLVHHGGYLLYSVRLCPSLFVSLL